jgi:SAM-dependent methyltransferase
MQFNEPTPIIDSTYILEDQERMQRAKNYFAWQRQLVLPEIGQRVVEIGCGLGNFTEVLLDRELVIALDKETGCIERLRARYPDQSNLNALTFDLDTDSFAALTEFRPDSCVCLNVLEHVRDDHKTLGRIASILPEGGTLVLLVPAFGVLYGPIDRNLGHYRRYTRTSFLTMVETTGLYVKTIEYMNMPGFFGWWMNSHVFRRQAQSESQIEVFDRFIVPLISRVERVMPPPFGQSLFVVLEKR